MIEALAPEDRRHPYRLTSAGERLLQMQLADLERFVATGLARLRPCAAGALNSGRVDTHRST